MRTLKKRRKVAARYSNRKLYQLELRIARRADELLKAALFISGQSLECWLRAEREVFGEVESGFGI
jgi:hypothetical protein